MKSPSRIAPILLSAWAALSLVCMVPTPLVHAQSSSRDSRTDNAGDSSRDEGRDERRESWRSRFGGRDSNRGRESRSSREGDESGRDEQGSRSSSPATAASGASRPTTSTGDAATSMNMADYAKSLVKQHDKNGNMMLEADERRELRGRAALADSNHDNVITIDELVAQLSSTSSGAPSAAASTTGNSTSPSGESEERRDGERSSSFGFRRGDRDSGESRSRFDSAKVTSKRVFTGSAVGAQTVETDKNKRRSYRFTPPAERLPTGLPSWFKSRDANGDGQVAMSEYSRSWSSRTVAEFRRYDLNDDGIITPKEVGK